MFLVVCLAALAATPTAGVWTRALVLAQSSPSPGGGDASIEQLPVGMEAVPEPEASRPGRVGELPPGPVSPVPAADADASSSVDPGISSAEGAAPSGAFVKGELTHLGADRLTVANSRIGVSTGIDRFGQAYYILVEPQVDLRFLDGKLGIGLGAPLRLELFNFDTGADGRTIAFSQLGRFRALDYGRPHDFGRILKYVKYGQKEDTLYISAGQRYAATVGHGAIVRRYSPNIDIDYPRASIEVDAYNDYAGFELMSNDVIDWNMLGGMAFLKPLAFISKDNLLTRTFSIGVTGAVDITAPTALSLEAGTPVRVVDEFRRMQAASAPLGIVGIDVEMKVVKTRHVDIKPYLDYSMIVGGDGGLTAGVLGRFNVGTDSVHAFRTIAEFRLLGPRYQPSYFDTFYEIDRFMSHSVGRNAAGFLDWQTKRTDVLSGRLGQRMGYYLEGSWGVKDAIGLTVAFEGTTATAEKNFVAHLEIPWLSFLKIFGSYYKRGWVDISEFGQLDHKTIVFAGARLKALPFLFFNGRLYKAFRVNPDTARYDNQLGFIVDLEIGYEFAKKTDADDDDDIEAAASPSPAPVQ